jgi:hypothetical protein
MNPVETPLHPSTIRQNRRSGRRWLAGSLIGVAVLAIIGISALALNWPFISTGHIFRPAA